MIHLLASAALLLAAGAASAAPIDPAAGSQTPGASSLEALRPLAPAELGALNGGQSVTGAFSNTALTELNAGNSITAGTVVSGGVTLGSNAFNGFDGLGNFVINTGNNNNLQGSLTVTVLMVPGLSR